MTVVVIMLGGALGAITRYGVGLWLGRHLALFPLGTLVVNVVGAFLLSLLVSIGETRATLPPLLRAALATGYLGSLTTFSTFEVESAALIRDSSALGASLYVLGNLILGYGAVLLARYLVLR